jgi:hypothetical protein
MPLHSFRNSVLGGLEIRKKREAENIIKIGCACFGTILVVRYYCLLLQELGVDYAFLDKEYCCLSPALYRVLARKEDRTSIDEASRKVLTMNNDEARRLGAKNMIYFCPWCAWKAKWLLADSDIKQIYIFDLITPPQVWEGKRLRLNKKVGFVSGAYGVGADRLRIYVPDHVPEENVRIPWQDYHQLLDRIEGLQVVDSPPYSYPLPRNHIFNWAREHNLSALVVDHPVEYGGLTRMALKEAPEIKVRFLSDILLEAIGWTPWK